MRFELIFLALALSAGPFHAAAAEPDLPLDLTTVDDGRATIHQLYASYATLLQKGWELDGYTRFEEQIEEGIVGPVADSSIDELMSAKEIIVEGAPQAGPAARTVLAFETPAGEIPLAQRVRAHETLLRRMILMITDAAD